MLQLHNSIFLRPHLLRRLERLPLRTSRWRGNNLKCAALRNRKHPLMSKLSLIALRGSTPSVALVNGAEKTRDALLRRLASIKKVDNQASLIRATDVLKEAREMLRQVEDSRKVIKKPVLEIGRKIDALADAFASSLDDAFRGLNHLVSEYMAEEERKRREAEEARAAEAARIEAKRAAEAAKIEEALQAKLAAAETEKARERAEAQAEARLEKLGDKAAGQYASLAPAPVAQKVEGVATRREWKFEVVDVEALHAAYPHLVRLVPEVAAIKAALRGGTVNLPGVRAWQETQAVVKGGGR